MALLAGIEKILEASKERDQSVKIGTDLKALVQDLNTVTNLYEESRVQLEAKSKEVEHLRQREKEVAEKEVVLDKLKENFEKYFLAQEESRKARECAVQSLAEANQKNAEAHQKDSETISNWVALTHEKDRELRLSLEREKFSAESHENDRIIWEKTKQELQDVIRDLETENARTPRLDVATEPSESGEKLKQLQSVKERLKGTIATNATIMEEMERTVSQRKQDLEKKNLDEGEKKLIKELLTIAEAKRSEHQTVCDKATKELRECENGIQKELQNQNTASSSSTGANSQWSADTSATTNTTLTRSTSDNPEIEAKNTTDAAK